MLEIYTFNVKQGDSFLIKFPDNKYGVIDCNYTDDDDSPPLLRAIKRLQINKFAFICVSHPHADHYRGFKSVLNYIESSGIPVDYFIDFGMSEIDDLFDFKEKLTGKSFYKKACEDFISLYDFYQRRKKENTIRYRPALGFDSFMFNTSDYSMRSYAPLPEDLEIYRKLLIAALSRNITIDNAIDHNIVSSLIRLFSNNSRGVLFGGDLPKDKWMRTLRMAKDSGTVLKSILLKVSHHGSKKSYVDNMFADLYDDSPVNNRVAIISCGSASRGLPDQAVIQDLISNNIYPLCTNKNSECSGAPPELRGFSNMAREVMQKELYYASGPCLGNMLIKIQDGGVVKIIAEKADKCKIASAAGITANVPITIDQDFWQNLLAE